MRNLIHILRCTSVLSIFLFTVLSGSAQSAGSGTSLRDANENSSAGSSVSMEENKINIGTEINSKGFIRQTGERNKEAMDMSIGTDQVFSAGNKPGLVISYKSRRTIFYKPVIVMFLIYGQTEYWSMVGPI